MYRSKALEKERLIRSVTKTERADLVKSTLEFFSIDTSRLTRDQQYQLALKQIHARAIRFKITAIVVALIALLCAGVSAYALSRESKLEESRQALEFSHAGLYEDEFENDNTWKPFDPMAKGGSRNYKVSRDSFDKSKAARAVTIRL